MHVGTKGYIAPELIDEEEGHGKEYSHAVDIWSLGAVAYCLRAGKPPFPTTGKVLDYQAGRIRFPVGLLRSSSALCGNFISEAMTRMPADRMSMEEVLEHPWLAPDSDDTNG